MLDSTSSVKLQYLPGWGQFPDLLDVMRQTYTYPSGEDRVGGYLYSEGEQSWPDPLVSIGPELLASLVALLRVRFTTVVFQAYRNGSGCDWHADTAFDAQAVLSLGVTRTFAVRPLDGPPRYTSVAHGDLVYMPPGFQSQWEHSVPTEDVEGERCSLVFRTVKR